MKRHCLLAMLLTMTVVSTATARLGAEGRVIVDLTGINHATNLTDLSLYGDRISLIMLSLSRRQSHHEVRWETVSLES